MEGAFTERNVVTDYPRNFDEAYNNVSATIEMIDKGELRQDVLCTIEWAKPINFQNDYDSIVPNHQVAESSYLSSKTILEFVISVPRGHYVKPSDFELVLAVRFRDVDNNRINLGQWIPANNIWRQFLEAMTIVRKQDLKAIVQPRRSGSLAYHARSIMQHMTDKQLQVIERDMLFVNEPVTGPNVHYRINQPNGFGNYQHI